jgi:translation initiation factor 5
VAVCGLDCSDLHDSLTIHHNISFCRSDKVPRCRAGCPNPDERSRRQVRVCGGGRGTLRSFVLSTTQACFATAPAPATSRGSLTRPPCRTRYIVNGAFEADRFQEVLDGFIKKFVLCKECSNPETVLRVTKKKEIESACKACGHRCFLPLAHKLTTFIINNPPDGSGGPGGKKGRSKEERRRAKRGETVEGDGDGDGGDDNEGSDTDPTIVAAAAAAANDDVEDDDDLEWSVDTSEEAARKRAEDLGTGVTSLTMTDDLEKPVAERLQIFETFVEAKMSLDTLPAKAVVSEADRLDCKNKGIMVLVGILFKDGDIVATLKKHQGLFQRFTIDNPKAEKNCLGAIEKLIEIREVRGSAIARIFKELYDLDIIDEERFIAWADKASKKNVSSKALAAEIQVRARPARCAGVIVRCVGVGLPSVCAGHVCCVWF